MKPYYDDGRVTIYNADCLDVLPHLDPVDLVLTDPPYNIGKTYTDKTDDDRDDYAEWCSAWFDECQRLASRTIIFPGLSNLPMWPTISRPTAIGCWHLPGSPGGGFPFSFIEWEPWLYWGKFLGGSNVVRATISEQPDTGDHPCPKPIKLFRTLIDRCKADVVLDPFMGSGTAMRAAKDLNRRAIGIEVEERYCEIAAKRCAQDVLDFAA